MLDQINNHFPDFLHSYDSFVQHIRGELEGLNPTEKGKRFAQFVKELFPETEMSKEFDLPILNERQSHDEGIDLEAQGKDSHSVLYIQSKLHIDRADTLDSILSKFHAYYQTTHGGQEADPQLTFLNDERLPHFLIATCSVLDGIIGNYEGRSLSSKHFYEQLLQKNHLHFIDGTKLFSLMRAIYSKTFDIPTDLVLNLESKPISMGNVYLGIMSSKELKALHSKFGDALFFENVRDFIGLSEAEEEQSVTTPNDEILKTIEDAPQKMLERNNGIVLRADLVVDGEAEHQLKLSKGSVVNGCQTTMCVVNYNGPNICYVPVKIVQNEDSWDMAKSANYQNEIAYIDLEIARSMRRQLVMMGAARSGIHLESIDQRPETSIFRTMNVFHHRKVTYEAVRLLYIGLFSDTPNSVYYSHRVEKLVPSLVRRFHENDPYGDEVLRTLFKLAEASEEGLEKLRDTFEEEEYIKFFTRLFNKEILTYRNYLGILTLCGILNIDVSMREEDGTQEFERMRKFLSDAFDLLDGSKETFLDRYQIAAVVWMQAMLPSNQKDETVKRGLASRAEGYSFSGLFHKLRMQLNLFSPHNQGI